MALAKLRIQLSVTGDEGQGLILNDDQTVSWAATVVKRETVSLTGSSTFTALSPPSGSKAVFICPPSGTTSLTLKGVTGDGTGITIVPASTPILAPLFITLGASPSIGILNGGSTVSVVVIWL
jgi:hypothetical protein